MSRTSPVVGDKDKGMDQQDKSFRRTVWMQRGDEDGKEEEEEGA